MMYKIQDRPDGEITLASGAKTLPLATLKDEYGGISHIIQDDHCFVLVNGTLAKPFRPVHHWYWQAAVALAGLLSTGEVGAGNE